MQTREIFLCKIGRLCCKRKEVFVFCEVPVKWVTLGITDKWKSKIWIDKSMDLLLFCPWGAVVDGSTNTHRSYTLTQCLRSAWKLIAKELSLYAVSKISDSKLQFRSTQQDRMEGQSPLFYFRSRGGQWCHHFRFRLFSTKAADQNWFLAPFWNTWARAASFLFPVQMVLEAPSFPFPEHVGGPFGPPPFPFPVGFGAKNLRQAGCACKWQPRLRLLVEQGYSVRPRSVCWNGGAYPFAAATAPTLSSTLSGGLRNLRWA